MIEKYFTGLGLDHLSYPCDASSSKCTVKYYPDFLCYHKWCHASTASG